MSPARHSAICAEIQQLHQTKESKLLARIAELEAQLAKRTWVGLRDDEIYYVLENLQVMHHRLPTTDSRVIFAQAIEAKLKEKNT